jgi:hypothetical protein
MKSYLMIFLFGSMARQSAWSAVIDLSSLPTGFNNSQTLVTPNATFHSETGFFIGNGPTDHGICASNNLTCAADFDVVFNSPVNDLSFTTSGFDAGDSVKLSAYNALDNLIGSVSILQNGLVDLSAFSGIKKVFFDDSSLSKGAAYDSFAFNTTLNTPIPAAFWLFCSGLVALYRYRQNNS